MKYEIFYIATLTLVSCVTEKEIPVVDTVIDPGDKIILSPEKTALIDIPDEERLRTKLTDLEDSLSEDKGNKDLIRQIIDIYFLLKNYNEVVKYGKMLLTMGVNDITLRVKIANASLRKGKANFAEFVLAVPECAKSSDCQNLLGIIMYQRSKILESMAFFKKSVTLNSRNPSPALNLSLLYMQYYKFDDAWDVLNGVLKISKKNPNALLHKSILLGMKKDDKKAVKALQRLREIDNKNPLLLHNLAVLYKKMHDPDSALMAVNRALKYAQEYGVNIDKVVKLKEEIKIQKSTGEK